MVLLDQEVFPDPPELLESAERSVLVVQVELLDHLVNAEPQEEEAYLELTDPLDLKVKLVIEDLPVQMDLKVKLETLAGPDLLVYKDFAVYLAVPDPLVSLVALVNAVFLVPTAKTENKDLRVSKVFQDLLESRENVVLLVRTAKMETPDRLDSQDLEVMLVKTEQQVLKVLPVRLVLMVNVALLALLDQEASKDFLVFPERPVTPEKTVNLDFKDHRVYPVPVDLAVSVDSLASVVPLVHLEHLASAALLA